MTDYIESDDEGLAQLFEVLSLQDRWISGGNKQWIRDNTADPAFFQGLIDRGIVKPVFSGRDLVPVSQVNPATSLRLHAEKDFILILSKPLGLARIDARESDHYKMYHAGKGTANEILGPVSALHPNSDDATDRENIRYCVSQVLAPYLDTQKRGRLLDLVRELEHRENRDPSAPASYLDLVYPSQSL